ncbi:MAG TPA: ABC transporter substrate-binding protein [Flavobacteriales bacterium]|nr:ABC transporter substrate-binding protein [Flavobacteriales bacterium]
MRKKPIIIISLVVVGIGALAVLRFKPWQTKTVAEKDPIHNGPNEEAKRELTVGYLPVTCHLTCPVTDYASKTTESNTNFNSQRFMDFPTVVSALQAKQIQATFMIAPLAMKLRADGVPVKICYLGHRDGSEIIIAKNNPAKSLRDMKGKKIAVPSLYSNQYLVLNKLMEQQKMDPKDIEFIVLPPPDMPTSLAAGAIDGYFVGEPFCAKAELDGTGRVLYLARDIWPNFVSCALVVHEDLIKEKPEVVKDLVRGIAQSGQWAEEHRAEAAKLVTPYYRQDQKVLNYVLTSSPHRVSYTQLTPTNKEFEEIKRMAMKLKIIEKDVPIDELLERSFIPKEIKAADIKLENIPEPKAR